MKQELLITAPKSWRGITLRQYLAWQRALRDYPEAGEETITLAYLCGLPPEHIHSIPANTLSDLRNGLSFLGDTNIPLQKIIQLEGKEWGFEPNLSQMAYGAYLDLTKTGEWNLDDKWSDKMNILYRPVTKRAGSLYEIQPYGKEYPKPDWNEVTMDIHWGAYTFFFTICRDLLKDTLKSMKEGETLALIKSALEKNGEDIQAFMKSLEGTQLALSR